MANQFDKLTPGALSDAKSGGLGSLSGNSMFGGGRSGGGGLFSGAQGDLSSLSSSEGSLFKKTTTASPDSTVLSVDTPQTIPAFYSVIIRQDEIPGEQPAIEVRGHLPETISIDTQSDYDTPFAEGLIPHRRIQLVAQLAGWSPTVQAMTAHFWKGSSPIDIQLPLTLIAEKSGDEITQQILRLKVMQMPSVSPGTGFLRAPGPKLKLNLDVAKRMLSTTTAAVSQTAGVLTNGAIGSQVHAEQADSDRMFAIAQQFGTDFAKSAQQLIEVEGKISIRIGKFLHFSDVVIRGVSDEYNVIIGPDGLPQRCTVTVQATTRLTPTVADLPEIYCVSKNSLSFTQPAPGKQTPVGTLAKNRIKE
jgi:hypothetical protein